MTTPNNNDLPEKAKAIKDLLLQSHPELKDDINKVLFSYKQFGFGVIINPQSCTTRLHQLLSEKYPELLPQ